MDGCKRLDPVLPQALKIVDDMRLILQDAFGPDGRAVMFQQSNGHLTITRSGEEIIKSVFLHNSKTPTRNMFLKLISEVKDEIGDGVKFFVFSVYNILNGLKRNLNKTVVGQLKLVQVRLNGIVNKEVQNEIKPIINEIINTFFLTRFTEIVANYLSKLTFELVSRLTEFNISDILNSFTVLCVTFNGLSLSNSEVRDGFLFKGKVCNNFIDTTNCLVKVNLYSEETKPEENEIESDISSLILNTNNKSCTVLFITNVMLPDRARFLLNLKNIIVVHCVGYDETHFLFEYLLKFPNENYITECKFRDNYIWLSLSGVSQLILNAPSIDLISQYKSSVKDCLKLISFTSKKSTMTCKAGGYFEKRFVLHLMNTVSNGKLLPPVHCRRDLNAWLKIKSELLCDHFTKECQTKDNSKIDENFNVFLKNICSIISSDISEPVVLKTLCLSMWDIVAKFSDQNESGVDFVIVKLAILNKALSFVTMLSEIDGLLQIGKRSCLVNCITKQ